MVPFGKLVKTENAIFELSQDCFVSPGLNVYCSVEKILESYSDGENICCQRTKIPEVEIYDMKIPKSKQMLSIFTNFMFTFIKVIPSYSRRTYLPPPNPPPSPKGEGWDEGNVIYWLIIVQSSAEDGGIIYLLFL
jgi:hypothetical protein